MNKNIEGLIAAPFSMQDKQGNILYDRIPIYHDLLEKNKVSSSFIN